MFYLKYKIRIKLIILNIEKLPFISNKKYCITGGSGFIGSNLIRIIKKIAENSVILNVDKKKPIDKSQQEYWQECDLNNYKTTKEVICDFNPDYIIHLAADVTMDGKSLEDYKTNTKGVENIINILGCLANNITLLVASTQHVKKPGSFIYTSKNKYSPLGLYGKSKVITEDLIKKSDLKQNWFIFRPTLIWGPGNLIMANTIFNYINKNIYYHPKKDNTVRSYGYIDNACNQILNLCTLDSKQIKNRVFYIADSNLLQLEWISLANRLMDKGELKTIPSSILKILSFFGDYLKHIYPKFPVYTERYLNLISSNPVPLDNTFFYLGTPEISLYEGMLNTTSWLKLYYSNKK